MSSVRTNDRVSSSEIALKRASNSDEISSSCLVLKGVSRPSTFTSVENVVGVLTSARVDCSPVAAIIAMRDSVEKTRDEKERNGMVYKRVIERTGAITCVVSFDGDFL